MPVAPALMILFQVERHDSELHRPCSIAPHDPAMLRTIPLSRKGVYRVWGYRVPVARIVPCPRASQLRPARPAGRSRFVAPGAAGSDWPLSRPRRDARTGDPAAFQCGGRTMPPPAGGFAKRQHQPIGPVEECSCMDDIGDCQIIETGATQPLHML